MRGTVLAGCLVFAILTMVETAAGILCQMYVFFGHRVLLQTMTAVELYHPADCLLFSLYFIHLTQLSEVYNDHAPSHARLNSAENKQCVKNYANYTNPE